MKKGKLERLTISLPHDVAESLESIRGQLGNISTSAAVRTMIRDYLAEHTLEDHAGWRIGTLIMMFTSSKPDILVKRVEIKSEYRKLIHADTQVPLDDGHIFEVIVVRGHTRKIHSLISALQKLSDNKVFRWLLSSCEKRVP